MRWKAKALFILGLVGVVPAAASELVATLPPWLAVAQADRVCFYRLPQVSARRCESLGEPIRALTLTSLADQPAAIIGTAKGRVMALSITDGATIAETRLSAPISTLAAAEPATLLMVVAAGEPAWLLRLPELTVVKRIDRAAMISVLARRQSFLVAGEDANEWAEVSYDPAAPPIYRGLVHDFRMGEAIGTAGYLNPRPIELQRPTRLVALDDARGMALGLSVDGARIEVVQLDVRRTIASLALRFPIVPRHGAAAQRGHLAWLLLVVGDESLVVLLNKQSLKIEQWRRLPASMHGIRLGPGNDRLWLAGAAEVRLLDSASLATIGEIALSDATLVALPDLPAEPAGLWALVRRDDSADLVLQLLTTESATAPRQAR